MGLFDFFDRFDMSNPEAQLINSPQFNTAYNKPKDESGVKPIQYGSPGSALAGSLMNRLGMKKDAKPLPTSGPGGYMQGGIKVVRPSDTGGNPLSGGKTYGPSKQEMLKQGAKDYVPKGYQGLEKSGQVWGNVGNDPKSQGALPALQQTDENGVMI